MVNLILLPCEIIVHILMPVNIDIEDVVNLGLTCKRLYMMVIHNDLLWRRKLLQRWPSLREVHEDRLNNNENIREIVREGTGYEKELLCCLAFLPYLYNENEDCNDTCVGNIARLSILFDTAEDTYSLRRRYFHDKLINLTQADPLDGRTNLTNLYYAKTFIVRMKQYDMMNKWKKLRHLSYEQKTVEKIATLVAQWCQPYKLVFHSDIAASLDIIVQQVLRVLMDVYPAHSIFATSAEQFSYWRSNSVHDNYWNEKESRQIINIIGRVIFRELNFSICCVSSEETRTNPRIVFIDQVLESRNASPILLQIIIQSIARRLGVRCDLLRTTTHLFLCWRECYKSWTTCYIVDLFSDGSVVSKRDFSCQPYHADSQVLLESYSNYFCEIDTNIGYMQDITALFLVLRLTKNLANISEYTDECVTHRRWVSELEDMVQQLNQNGELSAYHTVGLSPMMCLGTSFEDHSKNGSMLCLPNGIDRYMLPALRSTMFRDYEDTREPNKSDLTDCILSVLSRYHKRKVQSRLTRKHLRYTIGMIVEIESSCKSAGVITGWTTDCCNCSLYLSWPRFGDTSEPIMCTQSYTILTCDDRELNVSQEFLKPLKMQKWINNYQIGQYFSHFEGTHYVPNQKLRMLYPMDVNILERKYSEH